MNLKDQESAIAKRTRLRTRHPVIHLLPPLACVGQDWRSSEGRVRTTVEKECSTGFARSAGKMFRRRRQNAPTARSARAKWRPRRLRRSPVRTRGGSRNLHRRRRRLLLRLAPTMDGNLSLRQWRRHPSGSHRRLPRPRLRLRRARKRHQRLRPGGRCSIRLMRSIRRRRGLRSPRLAQAPRPG
jgi:hypothetical protein